MNKVLKLVKVDTVYCDYLRQFDNKVPFNYAKKAARPFVGVLFEVNEFQYFAPLSSPKPKHLRIRNKIDFMRIDNGKLGAINFNNMIPVDNINIECIDLNSTTKTKEEKQYLRLLEEQLYWLNRNKDKIYKNSKEMYFRYLNNRLPRNVKDRCCNYLLLEEKCVEYNSSKVLQEV